MKLPAPSPLHVTLSLDALRDKGLADDGRLILVGDVHGCDDELSDLLRESKFDSRRDLVVLLGDLVNKVMYRPFII
jgi:ubiquinone biosynthesis protein UbiJ